MFTRLRDEIPPRILQSKAWRGLGCFKITGVLAHILTGYTFHSYEMLLQVSDQDPSDNFA